MTSETPTRAALNTSERRARMEALGAAIQPLRARLADIEAQRPKVWHGTAPDGASEREIAVTRLQLQLAPLEEELEILISEEDAEQARLHAAQAEELERRHDEAAAQLPELAAASLAARQRLESLLPEISDAVRQVLEAEDALGRARSELAPGSEEHRDRRFVDSRRVIRSRVGARVWYATAEGGVQINDRPLVRTRTTPLADPAEVADPGAS